MTAKTTHVVPRNHGWAVMQEGRRRPSSVARDGAYSTQKQALEAARDIVRRSPAGQIVVHDRDGSMHWRDIHGLPAIQKPPRKSDLGTEAIKKAVFAVIRKRLEIVDGSQLA
jgi:hypothetical protein